MLGGHSEIYTHPEPHLITPLAHMGYHARVDAAPYDHINAAEAIRSFVDELPGGEADYLDALRAYADTMYGRMLATSEKSRFLDKTPAYALVLPFLAKLYPNAKYIVLTRHPLAVFSSYANSFYNGDWNAAHDFNPVVERYVSAMGSFLRERPVPLCHVAYADLVSNPVRELERLFAYLGLENQPEAVNYGSTKMKAGMGDPTGVHKDNKPNTASVEKWVTELSADSNKRRLAESMIDRVSDEDLAVWGWPRDQVFAALEGGSSAAPPKTPWNSYTVQRRVMLGLRKGVHARPEGEALVRRIRYYCDVILRDHL